MEFKSYLTWRGSIKFLLLAVFLCAFTSANAQSSFTLRVMAANLNGDVQSYQPFALRIFEGLKPDVVCIQEFDYNGDTDADFRSMVDTAFGTNFVYFRETIGGGGAIPNGIISRYPIVASGSWTDSEVANRGFAWARIHLPGTNDLYVVSVHLLTTSASERGIESAELKTQMISMFPTNAWMVLAGDFNCGSRTESPGMPTLETFLSDNPIPVDDVGNSDTSINRNHPHDYVMPSFSFTSHEVATVFPHHTYPTGLVFDSRVYSDLTDFAPVQSADSGMAQHMAVMKDFLIPVPNSTIAPVINPQPASQTIAPGSTLTIPVTAIGTATLTYQWFFNGNNIPGATTNPYTLYNAQATDSGNYSVFVTNNFGSVLSSNAVINVTNIPPNITSQPLSLSLATSSNATFSVTTTGTVPLSYQWMLNSLPISGATTNPFTIINAQTTNSGIYSVIVTNGGGSILSSNALLTVTNIAPAITSQPQGQTVGLGAAASFSVSATGTPPLAYQWQVGGTPISGANSSSFTIGSAQPTDAADYQVVVTNIAGSVTSSVATLTVNAGQQLVIAQWNFNSVPPDGSATTGTTTPSAGTGTAALFGGTTASFATGDTTFDPAGGTDNSGWNTTGYPA
ncbi:MAG TPA: immunoglobulin domain-containing protein, partial [Verrucomicrobiae bacterium]|nr:immunoglobulin domain-containing protein [Verrucomicrobiae bacterium]